MYLNFHPGDRKQGNKMSHRYITLTGNVMLNWAINRPVTGETFNHRFWPLDTKIIDITNTAYIESLLYSIRKMERDIVSCSTEKPNDAPEAIRPSSSAVNCKTNVDNDIKTLLSDYKEERG
jgi:hypothetical protein